MPSATRRRQPTALQALMAAAAIILLAPQHPRAAPMEGKEKGKPNRLAKESSPYLLQHAHNPVDWYPWGPEAFERAKKEGKLVFLSIGYSSCHWCHVMERESFSQSDVAEILNKNFICIKVDREERPDVDDIYMTALHAMGARGGWPLSMFLTPDGKPVVGGTYWPKEDRMVEGQTLVGFKTVLKRMLEVWTDKAKEVQTQADHYAELTTAALGRASRANPLIKLERALANGAAEQLVEDIDPVHGGIGRKANKFQGTKFPMVSTVNVLFDHARREKDADLTKLVRLTLDRMAMGGIYDQIGGGFHRYSTERTWTVPHFEKMLYDNAQLVELYADAFDLWRDPYYERVIRQTLAFVKREMTSPEGGFYSALDADSDGAEGQFYIWVPGEIEKALGNKADAAFIEAVFSVGELPNFEEKNHILRLNKPLVELAKEQKTTVEELDRKLAPLTAKLMAYRGKRVRPFLDTKVLTSWNGQMIGAYARAGQVLKDEAFVKSAARAADFVLTKLRNKDGRLLRTYSTTGDGKAEAKLNAYLDDYAFLIYGLLNLYDATQDNRWLDEAKKLNAEMVKWYGDPEAGGYYFTSSDHEKLFARPKDYADNAQPSANGLALRNQVRLWKRTKNAAYKDLAEKSLRQYSGMIRSYPVAVPNMCLGLHEYLDTVGGKDEAPAEKKDAPGVTGQETTEGVVQVVAEREKGKDGKPLLRVTLNTKAPWHIYANPPGLETLARAATTVTLRADGKLLAVEPVYPEGELEKDDFGEYRVYGNTVAIVVPLPADVTGSLEVSVRVQACTSGKNGRCLTLTTLKATAK